MNYVQYISCINDTIKLSCTRALCHVPLHFVPPVSGMFPCPWISVGPVTSMDKTMLTDDSNWDFSIVLTYFHCSLHLCLCHENMTRTACWKMTNARLSDSCCPSQQASKPQTQVWSQLRPEAPPSKLGLHHPPAHLWAEQILLFSVVMFGDGWLCRTVVAVGHWYAIISTVSCSEVIMGIIKTISSVPSWLVGEEKGRKRKMGNFCSI